MVVAEILLQTNGLCLLHAKIYISQATYIYIHVHVHVYEDTLYIHSDIFDKNLSMATAGGDSTLIILSKLNRA